MYNLRYHIASLVGVFLALALGLILGGLVVQRGTVERQQGALVEGLQREFADLRAESRQLSDRNDLLTAYAGHVTDAWASGRLTDRTVLVVTNPGGEAGLRDVTEAVESAGGVVARIALLKSGFGLDDEELAAQVTSFTGDAEDLVEGVAAGLVAEWTAPAMARPLTDALVAADVLEVDGLEDGTMATGLVDVAPTDSEGDPAGLALAVAFASSGPAVVAEGIDDDSGLAAAGQRAQVSALDTLGTDVGRYTLIALMTGLTPGYYGTGDDAVAPFPTQ